MEHLRFDVPICELDPVRGVVALEVGLIGLEMV